MPINLLWLLVGFELALLIGLVCWAAWLLVENKAMHQRIYDLSGTEGRLTVRVHWLEHQIEKMKGKESTELGELKEPGHVVAGEDKGKS